MFFHTGFFPPKPTGYFMWKDALAELGAVWEPLRVAMILTITIPAICTSLSKH